MPIIITGTGTGTGTFEDLLTEFYARGFDYLNQDTAGRTRAERWINEAYEELCATFQWDWLRSTVSGTAPLTITDLGQVISVVDTTQQAELTHVAFRDLNTSDPGLATSGTPSWWYVSGESEVSVYPLNTTDTVRVDYFKVPDELVVASDTPAIPRRWRSLIVDLAVVRAMVDSDNYEAAQALQQIVDVRLMRMAENELVRTGEPEYVTITNTE